MIFHIGDYTTYLQPRLPTQQAICNPIPLNRATVHNRIRVVEKPHALFTLTDMFHVIVPRQLTGNYHATLTSRNKLCRNYFGNFLATLWQPRPLQRLG
jgi:hypothetical protein